MDTLDTLVSISLSLTTALSAQDKYNRLLKVLSSVIPFDAATLFRMEKENLIPIASHGLSSTALGRIYHRKAYPRLDIICNSKKPVRFPSDSPLPDPFDGLVVKGSPPLKRIHDCLGCPLFVQEKLVGVLTADALQANAFNCLDHQFIMAVSALAAAHMQTADLIEALEISTRKQGLIARDLMRDIHLERGEQLIGKSPCIEALKKEINLVAKSNFTVMITGETGVGKELVARMVHAVSTRSQEPILYLNCAALPESLAESEIFGHVKGAFTGADKDRIGKFELADGGTLFLDEIGELPLSIQPKLLRSIQEGEVQRVGSNKIIHVDVRLLTATNRQLNKETEKGTFRPDLFHRLNVYPIRVPPLRERKEDIVLLSGYFCDITQKKLGTGSVRIDPEVLALLQAYEWPGNVRELENIISRSILKASSGSLPTEPITIKAMHLSKDIRKNDTTLAASSFIDKKIDRPQHATLSQTVKEFKQNLIIRTIDKNNGNWAAAARELGVHRSNLHNLAKKLGIH